MQITRTIQWLLNLSVSHAKQRLLNQLTSESIRWGKYGKLLGEWQATVRQSPGKPEEYFTKEADLRRRNFESAYERFS